MSFRGWSPPVRNTRARCAVCETTSLVRGHVLMLRSAAAAALLWLARRSSLTGSAQGSCRQSRRVCHSKARCVWSRLGWCRRRRARPRSACPLVHCLRHLVGSCSLPSIRGVPLCSCVVVAQVMLPLAAFNRSRMDEHAEFADVTLAVEGGFFRLSFSCARWRVLCGQCDQT